ncbi:hypothetical protein WOLCODRAFT_15304 [Wolfiporia cocos MD-104 SS10]|uniref:Uncharacterized protein n=1 Tax=Wolfiporia cocos (strain MD-104) TaxID=742152 RepID=A0A2H3IY85_WOLCO|nr:hypothetical protein WOLCODRAFT_15304 [Wolfiporia cocos MD-104 SS10]
MPALARTTVRSRVGSLKAAAAAAAAAVAAATSPDANAAPPQPARDADTASAYKSVREYEHDRHRAKKSVETERLRERKERKRRVRAGECAARPYSRAAHCGGRKTGAKNMAIYVEEEDVKGAENAEGAERDAREDAHEHGLDFDGGVVVQLPDVMMRDVEFKVLVKQAKPRKRRADDFEVVPKVRSVIALDDSAATAPAEMDEPWEHISMDDEERVSAPSYAQIVASAM